MSDHLEKFVIDHKSEFDSYEPSPDLWQKIIKIEEKPTSTKPKTIYYLTRVAAVLVVAFVSVFVYEKYFDKPESTALSNTTFTELEEAENYYITEINQKLNELETNYTEFSEVKNDVMIDLNELDKATNELKNELGKNINNEEVVLNLIETYRLKLDLLEQVLFQLHQVKNDNDLDNLKNI